MNSSHPASRGLKNPLTLVLALSAAFFAIFLLISGAIFMSRSGTDSSKAAAPAIFSGGSVGVVELNGVIMESKKILRALERFEDDGTIKAVVLRLNSPGGSVAPSQEIYEAVRKYKKPIVASMASVAASGAYYIACGARKVFANPGTITGSIGVIMEFVNMERLYDWAKIRRFSLKTGKYKDAGAEYREMSADERSLLQGMIDDVLGQFKKAVSDGRKLTMAQVTSIADGRIFSGSQAKAAKLVDELGTLQDAINEAAKMAKLKGKPNVVYPEKPRKRLLETLLSDGNPDDDASGESGASDVAARLLSALGLPRGGSDGPTALATALTGLAPGVYWIWRGAH